VTKFLYLIVITYTLVVLVIFPKWTMDDAYVTFRYADNLANHSELTWNIGEDPIEGYTGIALPVALAILIKAGISPVLGSKVIGVMSFFLGGLMLFLVLRKLAIRELVRGIVLLLYFTAPFMFVHSLSGLETILFSTVIVACVFTLLLCLEPSRYQSLNETLLLFLLLFASLVRPEGVVLAVTYMIAVGFAKLKYSKSEFWPFVVRLTLVYILPGLLYFIWRYEYYGQLFPNTFYAKRYEGFINKLSVLRFCMFLLWYITLPALGGLILNVVESNPMKRIREMLVPPMGPRLLIASVANGAFILLVLFQYANSHLIMDYSHRFFVPFFPLFLVGIGILLDSGLYALPDSRSVRPLRYRLKLLLVFLALVQLYVHFAELKAEISFVADYKQLLEDEHIQVGKFLKENVPSSEWLIVYVDAGAIPYFSGLKTVDFGRLNDEILSREDLSRSEIVDYFYSFNAGAVVFTSHDWNKLDNTPEAASIANDPRFRDYVLVRKYGAATKMYYTKYYEFVFLRGDLLTRSE
jgi:arabinofuranosyltransferase